MKPSDDLIAKFRFLRDDVHGFQNVLSSNSPDLIARIDEPKTMFHQVACYNSLATFY